MDLVPIISVIAAVIACWVVADHVTR